MKLKIIHECGFMKQCFNEDRTVLYWKTPSRTFRDEEEKILPDFKVSKDRLTLLLRANAAGDLKLKLMLTYHSENPRVLKN